MKTLACFRAVGALCAFSIAALSQSGEFAGIWQIRKAPNTGRVNLTFNLFQSDDQYVGSMFFVNPDASVKQEIITNAVVDGASISFETGDSRDPFHWSLTVDKDEKRGVLRGNFHHMLVQEVVQKKL